MQKIGSSTSTADANGEFTEGSAAGGVKATQIKAGWLNSVQRELIGVLTEAGLTPKADDDTQLRAAIKAIAKAVSNAYGIGGAAVDGAKLNLNDATLGTITRFEGSQTDALALNYPTASSTGTVQVNFETLTYGMDGRVVQEATEVFGAGGVGRGRTFCRVKHDNTWFPWREGAMLDSPAFSGNPTAPTAAVGDNDTSVATTAFVQQAMAVFGLGAASPSIAKNADDKTIKSGWYQATDVTTGSIPSTYGILFVSSLANGTDSSNWANQVFFSTSGRAYWRNSINLGAWSLWREYVFTESPVFTGTPSAPTAARGTATGQLATTQFVQDAAGARTAEIVFFPSTSAPAGFLKANGAAISRTAYAALFAVIGTNYGNGDGSSTFNLPDLRGEFLRGWDDGRGVDSGRALHSSQTSQNLSHNHSASASNAGAHTHTMTFKNDRASGEGNAVFGDEAYYGGDASQTTSSAGDHTHTISIGASGGNEARPRNIALLACIKY